MLNALVNFVLTDVVLPEINKFLVVGIPLPAITGVDFTKADLAFGNGYALLGVDFTFNPTFGAKVASSVSDK